MRRRHPRHRSKRLPKLWLMTDERQGEALWEALAALPRGSGVVFRHYSLASGARQALLARVRRVAARRSLLLVADGEGPVTTASAHNAAELVAAARRGADLVFLSPVHPTRTHPGAPALGRVRFGLLARRSRVPVIALGGMTARRAEALKKLGAYGWAAIDGLTPQTAVHRTG